MKYAESAPCQQSKSSVGYKTYPVPGLPMKSLFKTSSNGFSSRSSRMLFFKTRLNICLMASFTGNRPSFAFSSFQAEHSSKVFVVIFWPIKSVAVRVKTHGARPCFRSFSMRSACLSLTCSNKFRTARVFPNALSPRRRPSLRIAIRMSFSSFTQKGCGRFSLVRTGGGDPG